MDAYKQYCFICVYFFVAPTLTHKYSIDGLQEHVITHFGIVKKYITNLNLFKTNFLQMKYTYIIAKLIRL